MSHFWDRVKFIVPPLDGVELLFGKRNDFRPGKRCIRLSISEHHPVNALTKGVIKAWHEREKDPRFWFSKLLTFSFYAKHEVRRRFISTLPHGIECCLLLFFCEPEFPVDGLLKEGPAGKENAGLALPKGRIIQLTPAGLTNNDWAELVKMMTQEC